MDNCKYKNIFGRPNEGVHYIRFMGVAIVDVTLTIITIIIISYYTKYNWIYVTIVIIIAMIIFHRFFCVRTITDKLLFPNK